MARQILSSSTGGSGGGGGGGGGGAPTGPAGGDLAGTYPNPTVAAISGSAGTATVSATSLAFQNSGTVSAAGDTLTLTATDVVAHATGTITCTDNLDNGLYADNAGNTFVGALGGGLNLQSSGQAFLQSTTGNVYANSTTGLITLGVGTVGSEATAITLDGPNNEIDLIAGGQLFAAAGSFRGQFTGNALLESTTGSVIARGAAQSSFESVDVVSGTSANVLVHTGTGDGSGDLVLFTGNTNAGRGGQVSLATGSGPDGLGPMNLASGDLTANAAGTYTVNGANSSIFQFASSTGNANLSTPGTMRVNGDSRLDLSAGSATSIAMQSGLTLTSDDTLTANISGGVDIQSIGDIARFRATGGRLTIPAGESEGTALTSLVINDFSGGVSALTADAPQGPGAITLQAGDATNFGTAGASLVVSGGTEPKAGSIAGHAGGATVDGGDIDWYLGASGAGTAGAYTVHGASGLGTRSNYTVTGMGLITLDSDGPISIGANNNTGPSYDVSIFTHDSGGAAGSINITAGSGSPSGDLNLLAGNSANITAGSFVQLQGGTIQLNPTAGGALFIMNSFGAASLTSGGGQAITLTPDTHVQVNGSIVSTSSITCASNSVFSAGLTSFGNPVYGAVGTFEKSETGSDANVLTYTAGGSDEFALVTMAMDVSAITGTSIVVSVAWKDSNNVSRTSVLATVTATGGADVSFPINVKSGQNVVISTVFVGASTAYKISAFVARQH